MDEFAGYNVTSVFKTPDFVRLGLSLRGGVPDQFLIYSFTIIKQTDLYMVDDMGIYLSNSDECVFKANLDIHHNPMCRTSLILALLEFRRDMANRVRKNIFDGKVITEQTVRKLMSKHLGAEGSVYDLVNGIDSL